MVGNPGGAEVDIGRAVIAAADARGERGVVAKGRAGHGEEIGRTDTRLLVAGAAIARRADRQDLAAQRHSRPEKIAIVQHGHPIGPGIVHAQRAGERRCRKGIVGEGEQMHRTRAGAAVKGTIIAGRAHGQSQPVERERCAEAVRAVQYREVEVVAARIAAADGSCQRRAEQRRIGKGDQINRTAIGHRIASAIIARRPHGQLGARQRHCTAEPVVSIEADAQIVSAGIAQADLAEQAAAVEVGVGKDEQVDGAGIRDTARHAAIAWRADRKPGSIERYRAAKARACGHFADRDILAPAIAAPDDALQNRCRKIGIGKGEEIDRTGIGNVDAVAIIARRTDRQPVAVERYRGAETVPELQPRDRRAQAARIAGADRADQFRAAEIEIGESEEIDRAGISGAAGIAEAVVAGRAHHQSAAVERYCRAEEIELIERNVEIEIGAEIRQPRAQDFGNRTAAETAVGKAQQIDRTRIEGAGGRTAEPWRANGQSVAVQRDREAQKAFGTHTERRQGRVDIPGSIIAGADDAALNPAGKGKIGEREQIDRTRAGQAVVAAIIPARTDRQAGPVERDRPAEPVEIFERDVQIVAPSVEAEPDNGLQRAALEQRIGKGEQIDRAGLAFEKGGIACGVVAIGSHRQSVAVERNRRAEAVIGLQIGHGDVLAAGIAQADNGFERSTGKLGIGKAEQIDGAGRTDGVPGACIIDCADGETVAVERNRGSETVCALDLRDEQILPADISVADHRLQGRPPEQEIGEREKIDRTRIAQIIDRSVIACRSDRQPNPVQRHACAKAVTCPQLGERRRGGTRQIQPHRSAIIGADRAGQAAGGEQGIAELEELDCAAVRLAVAGAIVPRRTDREAVAEKRDGGAETVVLFHGHRDQLRPVVRADITIADDRPLDRADQLRVAKAVKIDSPGAELEDIARALIARCTDCQPPGIQRHSTAEQVAIVERSGIAVIRPGIAATDDSGLRDAAGLAVGKGEGVDRTDGAQAAADIARARIARCADGELPRHGIHRQRSPEIVAGIERAEVQAVEPGIARADGADDAACTDERAVQQQIDRARIPHGVAQAIVERCPDQQVGERYGDGRAEPVPGLERDIEIVDAAISVADCAERREVFEGPGLEGEGIDGTAIGDVVLPAIVARRPHGKERAEQRDRRAEIVACLQTCHRQVLAAGIARPDHPFEHRCRQVQARRVREADQIDRTRAGGEAGRAIVEGRTDGEQLAVQRDGVADILGLAAVDALCGKRKGLAGGIGPAHDTRQFKIVESRAGKAEQIGSPGRRTDAVAAVARRSDDQPGGIERDRRTEAGAVIQADDRQGGGSDIARADHGLQRGAFQRGTGKGKQEGRTAIEAAAGKTAVARRAHGQPVVQQGNRGAKAVGAVKLAHRKVARHAGIAAAERAEQRR